MKLHLFSRLLFIFVSFFLLFSNAGLAIAEEGEAPALVTPINDQTSLENSTFSLSVASHFSGGDEGTPLIFSASGLTSNLNISNDGLISGFVLTADIGDHLITITATDGNSLTATDSFTLSVISATTLYAFDDHISGIVEDSVSNLLDVLTNDTGSGSLLSVSTSTNGGSVSINGSQIEYTPAADFAGTESFTYTITNGVDNSTATVAVNVSNINDTPVVALPIGDRSATEGNQFSLDLNSHFSDADEDDVLSYTATGLPGSFFIDEAGSLLGLPANADIGTYTVTITASDLAESSLATDTFTLTIISNQSDLALDDSYQDLVEDSVNNQLNILANDPGLNLTIIAVSTPSEGGVVQINGNLIEYTPAANFAGIETFNYTVQNGASNTDTATVTLEIINVNDAPVFSSISTQTATESVAFSLDTAPFVSDVDDLGHEFSAAGLPDSLTIDPQGLISGTPRFEDVGSHSVTVTAFDRRMASDSQVFTLIVNENSALVAKDDYFTVTEGSTNSFNVLANDQGSSMVITSVTNPPSGGSAVIISGTSIEYSPGTQFFGQETLIYTIDDAGTSHSATINITVLNGDSPPIVVTPIADIANHSVGVTFELNVNNNFVEPDGQSMSFSMVGAPSTFSLVNGLITGSPELADIGNYSITVTASDLNGNSVSDTFNLTIIDDPTQLARNDIFTTIVKDSVNNVLDVLANDITPAGVTLLITNVTNPSQGGVVTIDANSSLIYTPPPGFEGVEKFRYTIFSNPGFQQFSADIIVDIPIVVPSNQPPQLISPINTQTKGENENYQLDLNNHFADENTNLIAYQFSGLPTGFSLNVDGILSGVHQTDAEAGTYTTVITATDAFGLSSSTSFEMNILAQNDEPFFDAIIESLSTLEDQSAFFDFAATFADEEDTSLSFSVSGLPASLSVTPSGILSGIPSNGDVGDYTIIVSATDSAMASASKSLLFSVLNVNDVPTVSPIAPVSILEDVNANSDISSFYDDVDVGDQLSFSATGLPANLTMNSAGLISGVPLNSDVGSYSVVATAIDLAGESVSATFTLNILNVNDAPHVVSPLNDETINEEETYVSDVSGAFSDVDGDLLTYQASGLPAGLSISTAGEISGIPLHSSVGLNLVTVTAEDPSGASVQDQFNLTVLDVLHAPVIDPVANQTVDELSLLSFLVTASDGDEQDTLSFSISGGMPAGASIDPVSGLFSWTPDESQGNATYAITIQVSDNGGLTDSTTVNVTVNEVDNAPIASDDSATSDEDNAVIVDILNNDSDDVALDPTSVQITQNATSGQVVVDGISGAISYQPDSNFFGSDSFKYTVMDTAGNVSNEAVVSFTINAVNDAPEFDTNAPASATVDNNYLYPFNATDAEGDSISYSAGTLPGWLSFDGTSQTLSGIPSETDIGSYTISLFASDGVLSTEQTFVIQVHPNTLADLEVSLSVKSPAHRAGNKANLKAIVENHGPDDARDVNFTVDVFGDVTVKGPGYCSVTYSTTLSQLVCEFSKIKNNKKKVINFTVSADDISEIYVVANATSIDDSVTSNNTATTTLSFTNNISNKAAVKLAKTDVVLNGDMDGDGYQDIVLVGTEQSTISVWRQDYSFKFVLYSEFDLVGAAISDAGLVDIDNDGDLDIITVTNKNSANLLYLNNAGQYQAEVIGNEIARNIAIIDINNDGWSDLIIAANGGNSVYMNNGIQLAYSHSLGNADSRGLTVTDVNNDGKVDVVFANVDSSNMVYLNAALIQSKPSEGDNKLSGEFKTSYVLSDDFVTGLSIASESRSAITEFDFNNDGQMDLIFSADELMTSKGIPGNMLMKNQGLGLFSRNGSFGTAQAIKLIPYDFDANGSLDLLALNNSGAHQIYVNQGGVLKSSESIILASGARSVAIVDLDSDGLVELVFASEEGTQIFANQGSMKFGFSNTDLSLDIDGGSNIESNKIQTYQLTLHNNGNNFADNIMIDIDVSPLLDIKSVMGTGISCAVTGHFAECQLQKELLSASSVNIDLLLMANESGDGQITASVVSNNNDTNQFNNKVSFELYAKVSSVVDTQLSASGSGNLLYLLIWLPVLILIRRNFTLVKS